MPSDYITRSGIITAATATYTALNTGLDGSTLSLPKVPTGRNRVTALIVTASIDGAVTVDVGQIFLVKLAGKAFPQGDQEIPVGALSSQEDGTSVGITVSQRPAQRIPVSIQCTQGNEFTVYGGYSGTDAGSQVISVTVEFSTGGGPVANYFTRLDSMTQATTTYANVDTTQEGATSNIQLPHGSSLITKLIVAICLNAAGVVTGANFGIKLSGTGMTEQEIIVGSTTYEAGAGTTTDTDVLMTQALILPVNIRVTGGNSLVIQAAYIGTDPGTPFVGVGIEVF